jgi:Zn-dependent protease
MNNNIRVGQLFGIPFYINPSWFIVLALVTWTYGGNLALQFPGLPAGVPWILGLVTALLLFASVLAHELGHSLVALRQGIDVKSITLFLFGGIAQLEKESKTPGAAFWVAIAGPLVSIFLFGLFTLIHYGAHLTGPAAAVLGLVANVNLVLALFNLIPGLPLDGGNILKALVWRITGKSYRGILFAGRAGQVIGWLAIVTGFIPVLLFGSVSGVWNVLIGWFLLQNASRGVQYATLQERLTGLTAADAVSTENPIASAQWSLREFADRSMFSLNLWRKFMVTDEQGQLLGEVTVDALRDVPSDRWTETTVGELVQPIDTTKTVLSDKPLLDVVSLLEEKHLSTLTVIRENGALVGLLEKSAIINLLQRRTQPSPA